MNQQTEKQYPASFTANEIQVLMNLIDHAVKSVGRAAAEATVHFERKFKTAIEEADKPAVLPAQETAPAPAPAPAETPF